MACRVVTRRLPQRPHVIATLRCAPLVDGRARAACILAIMCLALAGCAGTPRPPLPDGTTSVTLSPQLARLQQALKQYYRAWAGVPYRYGGTTRQGIDCSAFVRQASRRVRGIQLPRTTDAQVQRGYRIAPGELRPGDLVFFHTGGYQHVGIYIGHGRFMHASSSVGVTLSRLSNIYWRRHFWQARRLRRH